MTDVRRPPKSSDFVAGGLLVALLGSLVFGVVDAPELVPLACLAGGALVFIGITSYAVRLALRQTEHERLRRTAPVTAGSDDVVPPR